MTFDYDLEYKRYQMENRDKMSRIAGRFLVQQVFATRCEGGGPPEAGDIFNSKDSFSSY